ncbi:MAG: extracellular solute-binding protein [Uliginosibacterium sp.]|nr:extracellular solute-binding protein [Uliginosibacterium sp.]
MGATSPIQVLMQASLVLVCMTALAAPARKAVVPKQAQDALTGFEVELTHPLGADKDAQLRKLADRFNAQSQGGKVVVSMRPWGQGSLPAMAIVPELDEDLYLDGSARFKPLWRVMKDAGIPLNVGSFSRVMVPSALDSTRRLNALPVALSSPVVFYNKELLEKLGVTSAEIPRTWRSWVGVLGRFYTEGVACPMTASQPVSTIFENAAVWNNQPLTVAGRAEQYQGNGLVHVKHMAMMSSWRKSGYFYYFGRGSEAEAHFASGECGVLIAPSGAFPSLARQAAFTVAVAPYPYHDDAHGAPLHTVADGPSLWVSNNRTSGEYKVVARFIQFWLETENQIDWQVSAGYLPLSRAGVLVATESSLLKDDLVATRQALSQLSNKPATAGTTASSFMHRLGVRRILAEEIEQVFDDKKPPKQGLDDAAQRIRSAEDGCCRPRQP